MESLGARVFPPLFFIYLVVQQWAHVLVLFADQRDNKEVGLWQKRRFKANLNWLDQPPRSVPGWFMSAPHAAQYSTSLLTMGQEPLSVVQHLNHARQWLDVRPPNSFPVCCQQWQDFQANAKHLLLADFAQMRTSRYTRPL